MWGVDVWKGNWFGVESVYVGVFVGLGWVGWKVGCVGVLWVGGEGW